MPSGLPARVALVCTLVFGVGIARAERRPVAVIDLAGDPKTTELARELNPVLQQHPDLRPVPDPLIVPELFGDFRDDDARRISSALTAKQTAEERLARFEFGIAEQNAANGITDLEQVTPSTSMLALFAQLAFLRGQALLGIPSRASEARIAFALAHRVDPSFVPDPARYLPDVVRAFEQATKAWSGNTKLAVGGSGRVWVDGKEVGVAPVEIEVATGPHVVWLTGADRLTTAKQVVLTNQKVVLPIEDAPASTSVKVRRARAQLRYAPDAAARAAAMRHLAELVGVKDAVLLTTSNNKVIVQTWNAGTNAQKPGFSALREVKNQKPIDLLAALAPPKKQVVEDPPPIEPKPLVDNRRWYEKRPAQVGMVATVVAIAIASYYLIEALTDDSFTLDGNPQTEAGVGVRF